MVQQGTQLSCPLWYYYWKLFHTEKAQPREDRKLISLRLWVLIYIADNLTKVKAGLGQDGRAISYQILDGSEQATIA